MKLFQTMFLFFIYIQCSYSQQSKNNNVNETNLDKQKTQKSYYNYLFSFSRISDAKIIESINLVNEGVKMSEEDALTYVYNGDKSKLFCSFPIYNMESEKVEGISKELVLPKKCIRIDFENFILIAHSFYQCQSANEISKALLSVTVFNKDYLPKDTLIVYIGSEFETYISSLINPKNGKIFLYGTINNNENNDAILYKINETSLQFEIEKEKYNVKGDIDDLFSSLKMLNWFESFVK